MNQPKIYFLILVLVQGVHSIEEYIGNLWDVLPMANFLTGLFSQNHETGFLIVNIGLFLFGIWCWAFPIRKNWWMAAALMWGWAIIEIFNGLGHSIWAISPTSYKPGIITAPFLFIFALLLARSLLINKK